MAKEKVCSNKSKVRRNGKIVGLLVVRRKMTKVGAAFDSIEIRLDSENDPIDYDFIEKNFEGGLLNGDRDWSYLMEGGGTYQYPSDPFEVSEKKDGWQGCSLVTMVLPIRVSGRSLNFFSKAHKLFESMNTEYSSIEFIKNISAMLTFCGGKRRSSGSDLSFINFINELINKVHKIMSCIEPLVPYGKSELDTLKKEVWKYC